MSIWYWMNQGQREGPCSQEELLKLLKSGAISEKTFVWKEGFTDWISIGNTEEFFGSHESPLESSLIPKKPKVLVKKF